MNPFNRCGFLFGVLSAAISFFSQFMKTKRPITVEHGGKEWKFESTGHAIDMIQKNKLTGATVWIPAEHIIDLTESPPTKIFGYKGQA